MVCCVRLREMLREVLREALRGVLRAAFANVSLLRSVVRLREFVVTQHHKSKMAGKPLPLPYPFLPF